MKIQPSKFWQVFWHPSYNNEECSFEDLYLISPFTVYVPEELTEMFGIEKAFEMLCDQPRTTIVSFDDCGAVYRIIDGKWKDCALDENGTPEIERNEEPCHGDVIVRCIE